MDGYRTEEEQVEALRRWWEENGRSTVAAIVIALAVGFGWQGFKANQQRQADTASDTYQALLRTLDGEDESQRQDGIALAEQLKSDHGGSTYAQFAALHLAALAVNNADLAEAEAQLRWVLGKADRNSDTARIAQLRLARVLAAAGDTDQALAILAEGGGEAYRAAYAIARGDILLAAGRRDEAREAFAGAQALLMTGGQSEANLPYLRTRLQSLNPVPPQPLPQQDTTGPEATGADAGITDAVTAEGE